MATVAPAPTRPGRGIELVLLVLAVAVSIYAYAQVALAVKGALPTDLGIHAAGFTLLVLLLHLLVRLRAPYADPVILPLAVMLNGLGLAMIYRLALRYEVTNPQIAGIASRQLAWTGIGIGAAAVALLVLRDHRTLRRFTYLAMLAGLACLLLPLVPGIGSAQFGAKIWIRLGSMSFQPAELSKILLAVFFAGYLVTRRDTLALAGKKFLGLRLPRARDLGPILLAWAVSMAVLVFQRDLGTSLLFFALFVVMLYVATDRPSWIVIGLGMSLAGVAAAYSSFSHLRARFEAWIDPFDPVLYARDPGGSYQLVTGMFGLSDGGLTGAGWGRGHPELTPLAYSDFIYSALGEELGLTGLVAILVIYLILAERGWRTAIGVRDGFGKLLATGLSFVIVFQVFVVAGGVTRLIPLTGLTLPFLAYGGSSLVANWMIVAILARISDGARRPAPATNEIDLTPILEAERRAEAAAARAAAAADRTATQAVRLHLPTAGEVDR